eukprot:364793-Chlamydomonas_euryale.AAC.8
MSRTAASEGTRSTKGDVHASHTRPRDPLPHLRKRAPPSPPHQGCGPNPTLPCVGIAKRLKTAHERTAERARNRTGCAAACRVSDLAVTARRTAIVLRLAGCGWRGEEAPPPPAPAPPAPAPAPATASPFVSPPMGGVSPDQVALATALANAAADMGLPVR